MDAEMDLCMYLIFYYYIYLGHKLLSRPRTTDRDCKLHQLQVIYTGYLVAHHERKGSAVQLRNTDLMVVNSLSFQSWSLVSRSVKSSFTGLIFFFFFSQKGLWWKLYEVDFSKWAPWIVLGGPNMHAYMWKSSLCIFFLSLNFRQRFCTCSSLI